MAYTISIINLIRLLNQNEDINGSNVIQQIDLALPKIFNFDFPIWEENYRTTLERKIIMHYLRKEICTETPEMWKVFLNERLNLIMPFYNQMYKSVSIEYDMLNDVDWTETFNKDDTNSVTRESTGTVTENQTSELLNSDLPQANYAGVDYGTVLQNGTTNNNNTNTNKTTDSATNKESHILTKKGLSGTRSYTELILDYRNAIINIDKMIIDELRDLFMTIY